MGFASCLLRDIAQAWWDEVTQAVGTTIVTVMTWEDFVQRFDREFAPAIEVHQLAREFQDLCQTT